MNLFFEATDSMKLDAMFHDRDSYIPKQSALIHLFSIQRECQVPSLYTLDCVQRSAPTAENRLYLSTEH